MYHSTLGLRVIQKKRRRRPSRRSSAYIPTRLNVYLVYIRPTYDYIYDQLITTHAMITTNRFCLGVSALNMLYGEPSFNLFSACIPSSKYAYLEYIRPTDPESNQLCVLPNDLVLDFLLEMCVMASAVSFMESEGKYLEEDGIQTPMARGWSAE